MRLFNFSHSFLTLLLIISSICKSEEFRFNEIYIQSPWIKSTLPNQYSTSGFLKIKNKSNKDEILLNIFSDFAKKNEFHLMTVKNDIMKMKKIETGIKIKKGSSITFKPGNLHLMFMGVKYQLIEDTVQYLILNFKNNGSIRLPFRVKNILNKNKHKHLN